MYFRYGFTYDLALNYADTCQNSSSSGHPFPDQYKNSSETLNYREPEWNISNNAISPNSTISKQNRVATGWVSQSGRVSVQQRPSVTDRNPSQHQLGYYLNSGAV
ncbi:hypothetical protein RO3G_02567 [Rhizopus delemar RA 99-880]|uniref:Uncharacterized protein n=1 Tax=Rhizopus delemar (strain RA 99-880 / ATCC MYA-4621 / FGSC 9543 / NRRL 43880) TaxID=246409 RepID=I1BNT3_RHIO9|nr:hypothetical protein RO3G_02567 [Rhizopus delemar RA 99-880]|eukprot:EIE77863.1 hypothetical protein RO3G_02567 [Rhizopus delemar RA 99-880]